MPEDKKARARSGGVFSRASALLLRVFVAVVIASALFVCPSRPFSFEYSGEHPSLMCREIASAHAHLAPVAHSAAAQLHTLVEPYAGKYLVAAGNTWKKVQPAAVDAFKRAQHTYTTRLEPAARALGKQTYRRLRPYERQLQRHYRTHVQPHVTGECLLTAAHAALKPYTDIYVRDVSPYVEQGWAYSQKAVDAASAFYEAEVHPRIKQGMYDSYVFLRHTAFPVAHGHYVQHGHPHLVRAWNYVARKTNSALDQHGVNAPRVPLSTETETVRS